MWPGWFVLVACTERDPGHIERPVHAEVRPSPVAPEALVIHVAQAPAEMSPGSHGTLDVRGRRGAEVVVPTGLTFASSDTSILVVDDAGALTAGKVGVAYITVQAQGASALIEISVR